MEVGLGLGSNLGARLKNLQTARARVASLKDTRLVENSRVYETAPVNVRPEHLDKVYLNAVVIVRTNLALSDLSVMIHEVEDGMGRTRTDNRNDPRVIDIDIIYSDVEVSGTNELEVPHPRWVERWFVVRPLTDVRPDLIVKGQTLSVAEILEALPVNSADSIYAEEW